MDHQPKKGVWSKLNASKWEEGYFVGNGETGGILFGESDLFNIIVNHHTLYLKTDKMDDIPDMSHCLEELREIIKLKGYQAGIEFFEKQAVDLGYSGLTMSDLYHPGAQIVFRIHTSPTSQDMNFMRALDYETGLIRESFLTDDGQAFERKIFASKEYNSLFLELISDDHFSMDFSIKDFQQPGLSQQTISGSNSEVQELFTYSDDSSYTVTVKWTSDGTEHIDENKVSVTEAKYIRMSISVRPERDSKLEEFDQIEKKHVTAHSTAYNQVSLQIADEGERNQSYEELIGRLESENDIPRTVYEKFYDASRYFIQSMSGPALPNLQGIWSGDFHPAWSGDFTFDTNVQLAIASQASLGLFDQMKGLFEKVKSYEDDFRENALKYYGCRGLLIPVHASTRALHVHWNKDWPLVFWTSGAGWLAYFYDEYYEYTRDKDFLKNIAVPFYTETLRFYEDFVQFEGNVALFRPSYSAENGMGDNATMDIAVVKATIAYLKKAYAILGYDFPESYDALERSLPDYMVDSEGVLKEWIDESAEENFNHRHFSNLYPVFQTKEITTGQPELWKAAHKAFDKRLDAWLLSTEGDTSSSHGRMHAAMCAVALERPDDVEKALAELISNRSFFPSFASSHYNDQNVFNLDANGSFPKVIHDALIYTEEQGILTLFKAVPSWMRAGTLKGIRLPNQVVVDKFTWNLDKGRFSLELRSDHSGYIDLRLPEHWVFTEENERFLSVALDQAETTVVSKRVSSPGVESSEKTS